MQQNFFEAIGLADVERLHSQIFAWIFESTFLSANQKSRILTELVGTAGEYTINHVCTEHEHLDVRIETASSVIVIENKIKITEHDQQLCRYRENLEKETRKCHFVYLSLFPEAISDPSWTCRTYQKFHAMLLPHVFQSPANFGEYAFNEYVEAVGHLAEIVTAFNLDHTKFINVFTDGSSTKYEKCKKACDYSPLQNRVRANQLETPLQRYFLAKVRARLFPMPVNSRIEETRGVALLQIMIAKRSICGMEFHWGVQFQGRTAKLNCAARDYASSKYDQLPAEVLSDFERAAKRYNLEGPHRGRSKAYVSLSKELTFDWKNPLDVIIESYQAVYKEFTEIGRTIAAAHGTEVTAYQ